MPSVLIHTVTGDVNLRGKSAKVIVFHSPRGGGTERFASQAAKDSSSGISITSSMMSKSVARTLEEIGGRKWDTVLSVEEGTILKVFVKINPGANRMEKTANFYVRVRAAAAYRSVKIKTIQDDVSVLLTEGSIEGNFDMLTVDEAMAEGIRCLPQHRRFAEQIAVDQVISSHTVIAEEKKAEPKKMLAIAVDHETGNKISYVTRKKRRAIG
jgi:hypothetical protein